MQDEVLKQTYNEQMHRDTRTPKNTKKTNQVNFEFVGLL